jgi:hypothetical protein
MQDTELFLSLAEIAGVFVGFGALIGVRSGATMDTNEVNNIRWVVTTAIWVVIVALAPVIVSGYGITGHELWLACSLLALALLAVMIVVYGRTPENRAQVTDVLATKSRARIALEAGLLFWLPTALLVVALALVVLGRLPDQEQALYLTAVGLGLYSGAVALLFIAFSQGRPQPASGDRAGPADQGGMALDGRTAPA